MFSWPSQRVGWSWCQSIPALFSEWIFHARWLSELGRQYRLHCTLENRLCDCFCACLPACWLMFVISGDIGIRLAFIETYHMLGRMLAWKWGLHQPLIPGWSLNVLLETDSWAARLHLRFRRPQEMKQCFPYLPDLRNCLELWFKLRIPRSF